MSAFNVTITRDSTFADFFRKYKVVCDGRTRATLKRRGTSQFPVHPGAHELHINIDWCRSDSVRFNLLAGESAQFFCGNNVRGFKRFRILDIMFRRPNEYLWLAQAADSSSELSQYRPAVPSYESYLASAVLFVLLGWIVSCGYILLSNNVRVAHLKPGIAMLLFASFLWFGLLASLFSGQMFLGTGIIGRKENPIRCWFMATAFFAMALFVTSLGITSF